MGFIRMFCVAGGEVRWGGGRLLGRHRADRTEGTGQSGSQGGEPPSQVERTICDLGVVFF